MIHYFTHHGNIKKGTWLDHIRKYHVAHHFNDPDAGETHCFLKKSLKMLRLERETLRVTISTIEATIDFKVTGFLRGCGTCRSKHIRSRKVNKLL